MWTLYGGLIYKGLGEVGSTPSTTLHTFHAHEPHFLSKIASYIPFFFDHSSAELSHFIGPYRRHQASLSSDNGAKDQPLAELARNLEQGMPMVSSSARKLRRATSVRSHFNRGTRSLASSSKLLVRAVLGLLGRAPGSTPSWRRETYHCSSGGRLKPCCFCRAAPQSNASGISLGCQSPNSISRKSWNIASAPPSIICRCSALK